MMAALLKLERFERAAAPVPEAAYTAEDIEAAHARGCAETEAAMREDALTLLCRGLADAHETLLRIEAERAARRAEAAETLAPLVEALLAGVLPTATALRLQAALLAELRRLADAAAPVTGLLRCDPAVAPFAAACLDRLGLNGLALHDAATDGRVELQLAGGTVTFDRDEAAARLHALIAEYAGE